MAVSFQLHNDLAFDHVDGGIGIVATDYVWCARRIRHLNYAILLAWIVRSAVRTSGQDVTKSIAIKGQNCKSGGYAMRAVGLSPRGLNRLLGTEKGGLAAVRRSAEELVIRGAGRRPKRSRERIGGRDE
jgi:hypothetical protein